MSVSLVILLCTACSHKYRVDSLSTPEKLIPVNSHYYVMMAADGHFGGTQYVGSGVMVTDAVSMVLQQHQGGVTKATSLETLEQALERANTQNIEYVFRPLIVHWEDRATEWSGRPDRITMRYTIFDAKTGKEIASTLESASSKWGTFGGDHPQDLAPQTVEDFINSVSG